MKPAEFSSACEAVVHWLSIIEGMRNNLNAEISR